MIGSHGFDFAEDDKQGGVNQWRALLQCRTGAPTDSRGLICARRKDLVFTHAQTLLPVAFVQFFFSSTF
jgi:hypothetical protein